MKYKAMIGALALTLGLATVSHSQQPAPKDSAKKAMTATTTTKKHHRRHHKKTATAAKVATGAKKDSTAKH